MKEYYLKIIESKRKHGLLIDTNLLLLLFIGTYELSLIQRFKRTAQFSEDDFFLLKNIISQFPKIYTTPSILTEVSNLSNQLPNKMKEEYYSVFAKQLEFLEETHISSISLSNKREFLKFGLTDASIVTIAQNQSVVITVDFPLANYLGGLGLSIINFNHIRGLVWFGK